MSLILQFNSKRYIRKKFKNYKINVKKNTEKEKKI